MLWQETSGHDNWEPEIRELAYLAVRQLATLLHLPIAPQAPGWLRDQRTELIISIVIVINIQLWRFLRLVALHSQFHLAWILARLFIEIKGPWPIGYHMWELGNNVTCSSGYTAGLRRSSFTGTTYLHVKRDIIAAPRWARRQSKGISRVWNESFQNDTLMNK